MKKIKHIENVTGAFPEWTPSDVAFIKSFEWSIDGLIMVCYFQQRGLVGEWPDLSQPFFRFSIAFKKVRELKLSFVKPGLQQVSGFDIIDLSENGLENTHFQVEDYENGTINFYCQEILIKERPVKEKL